MNAMTAGALLRAAGRSFASNKSTGLAVAVQLVRLYRGQHSRGSRIGEAPRGTRDILSPNADRPSGFALLCQPRVERARTARGVTAVFARAVSQGWPNTSTHHRWGSCQPKRRSNLASPTPPFQECAFFLTTDKSLSAKIVALVR